MGSIRFALFGVLHKCRFAQNAVLPNLGETENCAERYFGQNGIGQNGIFEEIILKKNFDLMIKD